MGDSIVGWEGGTQLPAHSGCVAVSISPATLLAGTLTIPPCTSLQTRKLRLGKEATQVQRQDTYSSGASKG